MSLAGRRSNRGDAYQTQIAVDWAITMLADSGIKAVETDATMIIGTEPVPVDDVVISSLSGRTYCQCKKNEPDFKDWTVATLGDELVKAGRLAMADSSGRICFYSRSGFASLKKLREHAVTAGGAAAYRHGLGADNAVVDAALTTLFEKLDPPPDFVYTFLCRTTFEQTPEFETMDARQLERLRNLVARASEVHDSLWLAFDKAGAGMRSGSGSAAAEASLSREWLLERMRAIGAVVTRPWPQQDAERVLHTLSRVGREWRRDIDGVRLRRICSNTLANEVEKGTRSILVSGGPGAGKSCVLLDLADDLVASRAFPVYIQCRVFAEAEDGAQREMLGMPADLVGLVARLAEYRPVAVLFDSLDVLSLSREHSALNHFLAQADQLLNIPEVTVVAACRSFDAKYDRRLSVRDWNSRVELPELKWEEEVLPLLHRSGIEETTLEPATRTLIGNPRHLAMFLEISRRGHRVAPRSHQELTREFLDATVRSVSGLGDDAERKLEWIALDMLKRKSLEIGLERANLESTVEALLLSGGVLQRTGRRTLEFTHQTLLDVLAIASWERQGGTLESFIAAMPPVPFVRPAVRAYALHSAATDRRSLRTAVRAIVSSGLPHHLRRLVVETFADLEPLDEDVALINWLRGQAGLFEAFFERANSLEWHRFWLRHFAPVWYAEREHGRLSYLATRAGDWLAEDADSILAFWSDLLNADWLDRPRLAMNIGFAIGKYEGVAHLGIGELVGRLLALPRPEHDALGPAVVRAVRSGSASPELIWTYITWDVDDESIRGYRLDDKLRCEAYVFEEGGVLSHHMTQSPGLLSRALHDVRLWHALKEEIYFSDAPWVEGFLQETSYGQRHSRHEIGHSTSLSIILRAMEAAILNHASDNSQWWRENKTVLASARDGALRYWVVQALTANPYLDPTLAVTLASEPEMLSYRLAFEVGDLIRSVMPVLDHAAQDIVLQAIAAMPEGDHFLVREKCAMVKAVPASFRSPELMGLLEKHEREEGWIIREPDILGASGAVTSPFDHQRFLDADDPSVLRLLEHYASPGARERDWFDLVGGAEQVGSELREAASRAPVRFLRLLADSWPLVPESFREDIFEGCSQHGEHLFGRLQYDVNKWIPVERPTADTLVSGLLDELERHSVFWSFGREAARALAIVAEMAAPPSAERVAFHLLGFLRAPEPRGLGGNLVTIGLNSVRGKIAEAAVRMAVACVDSRADIPAMLRTVLRLFVRDESPAVRAMIVQHLPYFISRKLDFGWELFGLAMEGAESELWVVAGNCLYWAYHAQYERTSPYLANLLTTALQEAIDESKGGDSDRRSAMGTWARIATLSSLTGHVPHDEHVQRLRALGRPKAWRAAAEVWGVNAKQLSHREACLSGLRSAMEASAGERGAVASMHNVFSVRPAIAIPEDLITGMFRIEADSSDDRSHYHPHAFTEWLEAMALVRPEQALGPLGQLADFLQQSGRRLYDNGPIARTLTALYREAEEREMADGRWMLDRVVGIQDSLLAVGVHGLDDWLRAAERP